MFLSIFKAIEETGLSIWIRESDSVFSFWCILSVHAIGMGILVGASVLIGLRILGLAPDLPLAPLKRFYRFIWVGFWIQVGSGIFLDWLPDEGSDESAFLRQADTNWTRHGIDADAAQSCLCRLQLK